MSRKVLRSLIYTAATLVAFAAVHGTAWASETYVPNTETRYAEKAYDDWDYWDDGYDWWYDEYAYQYQGSGRVNLIEGREARRNTLRQNWRPGARERTTGIYRYPQRYFFYDTRPSQPVGIYPNCPADGLCLRPYDRGPGTGPRGPVRIQWDDDFWRYRTKFRAPLRLNTQ